jgi:hypothetical protein
MITKGVCQEVSALHEQLDVYKSHVGIGSKVGCDLPRVMVNELLFIGGMTSIFKFSILAGKIEAMSVAVLVISSCQHM